MGASSILCPLTSHARLHRAFSRMAWQRKTEARGFVRVNRWKVYVEEGLPRTPVQITYWDGTLRAQYNRPLAKVTLTECKSQCFSG